MRLMRMHSEKPVPICGTLAATPAGYGILATSLTNGVPVNDGLFNAWVDSGCDYFTGSGLLVGGVR